MVSGYFTLLFVSSSSLDRDVKSPLVADVLNLARYHIPNRMNASLRGDDSMAGMCHDSRLYGKETSAEERIKHLAYIQVALDGVVIMGGE